jgi:hypothetical protein
MMSSKRLKNFLKLIIHPFFFWLEPIVAPFPQPTLFVQGDDMKGPAGRGRIFAPILPSNHRQEV